MTCWQFVQYLMLLPLLYVSLQVLWSRVSSCPLEAAQARLQEAGSKGSSSKGGSNSTAVAAACWFPKQHHCSGCSSSCFLLGGNRHEETELSLITGIGCSKVLSLVLPVAWSLTKACCQQDQAGPGKAWSKQKN